MGVLTPLGWTGSGNSCAAASAIVVQTGSVHRDTATNVPAADTVLPWVCFCNLNVKASTVAGLQKTQKLLLMHARPYHNV